MATMYTIKLDGRGSGYVDRIDLEEYLTRHYPAVELDQFNMRVSISAPLIVAVVLSLNSVSRIAGSSNVRKS